MKWIYQWSVVLYGLGIRLFSRWNDKAAKWIHGRRNQKKELSSDDFLGEWLWVHCASLGEFEQGRPMIERLKKEMNYKIVLTFFSPSGYEKRKNYEGVDKVLYLPLDTAQNAQWFVNLIRPVAAIFVRYEFWYYHLSELQKRNIPTFLISASFRPSQLFFKPILGTWFRKMLHYYEMIFLLDKKSQQLLQSYHIRHTQVAGDTRADRVLKIQEESKAFTWLEKFKGNGLLFIVGSAWEDDIEVLSEAIRDLSSSNAKCLLAPHEVEANKVYQLQRQLERWVAPKDIVLYSNMKNVEEAQILILDTIGLLAYVYRYADVVYVGGGFGKGIHNVLEPAIFAKPVLMGKRFQKFPEAVGLVEKGGGVVIQTKEEARKKLSHLLQNEKERQIIGQKATEFTQSLSGATEHIVQHIINVLKT